MKTILVPLDGSALAEQILPYVRLLAALYAARVLLLRVITEAERDAVLTSSAIAPPAVGTPLKTDWQSEQRALSQLSQSAQEYLTMQARVLNATGVGIDIDVRSGPPAATIVEIATQQSDTVIAMTTHGYSGVRRRMLGSVADMVVHMTPIPVFVVRGAAAGPSEPCAVRRLLVPLDGSALAEQALPHAIELALRARAKLILLRVVLPVIEARSDFAAFDWPLPLSGELLEAERDQALQQLDALVEQITPYGVPIMPLVAVGVRPPEVIVDEAASHRADVIVMAIHAGSARVGWALGGGVDEVLHTTTTPLLLVPVHPHESCQASTQAVTDMHRPGWSAISP